MLRQYVQRTASIRLSRRLGVLQQWTGQSPDLSAGLATTSGRSVLESSYVSLHPSRTRSPSLSNMMFLFPKYFMVYLGHRRLALSLPLCTTHLDGDYMLQESLRSAFKKDAHISKHGLPAQMFSTSHLRQADSSVNDAELGPQDEDAKVLGASVLHEH